MKTVAASLMAMLLLVVSCASTTGRPDVNTSDEEYGATLLMWAAVENANPEVINTLLEAGGDARAKGSEGKTAFDYAEENEALRGTDAYWRLNAARF